MAQLAHKKKVSFSYDDYLNWDEGRWELIDGIVYNMTPAPSRQHQKISMDLAAIIHGQLTESSCEVYAAPFDVRLPDNENATDDEILTVVQPDIVVICDPAKLDKRGCLGAPDLVIEILSPATAAHDLKEKRDIYERHGVQEYWLVHPEDKIFMVYRLAGDEQYQKALILADSDVLKSSAVSGIMVNLEDIFGKAAEKTNSPPAE